MRAAFLVALAAALCACAWLALLVHQTRYAMDADEAVHAIEALRLADSLGRADLGEFLREAWTPERWAPPVNPHVRWYPPGHALVTAPFLLVLGASDFSARLPSVLCLFGSVLVFFALGRRLAPEHKAASGLLAALFLLAAPNVLTFSAQSLTEPASLFVTFLAFLFYLRSLERGHPLSRALLAGLLLAAALLTKYDHGGLFALCLGLGELLRQRGRVDRLLRSGAAVLFLLPLGILCLWFAGEKRHALMDSVRHPFAGSGRLVFLDFFLTWVIEYGSSLAMGGLLVLALACAWRRREPGVRILWLWALLTTLFLGLRSRFHFRYNFVEAPAILLLAAVLLPTWVERVARALREPGPALWRKALPVLGAVAVLAGGFSALAPDAVFDALRGPFRWLHGLRADHFGMALEPDAYVDFFAAEQRALLVHLGGSLLALGLGCLVLGIGAVALGTQRAERASAAGIVWVALATALVPGVARLYAHLPEMVDWELECHPETRAAQEYAIDFLAEAPRPTRVLLGGGWDQLTNNSLRWYALTRPELALAYDDVEVVGDMIGSLVFPPEPRIRFFAQELAEASAAELPEFVVLIRPDPERFLYRVRMGPEAGIYADLLEARPGYALVGERFFEALAARVLVWRRTGALAPPWEGFADVLARHGITPETPGNASRVLVGEGGWTIPDESPRHFLQKSDRPLKGSAPGSGVEDR